MARLPLLACVLLVGVALAPALMAFELPQNPGSVTIPSYMRKMDAENETFAETNDTSGLLVNVAGPMAYHHDVANDIRHMVTWTADYLHFLREEKSASDPDGWEWVVHQTLPLPSPFQGHNFLRQYMDMNGEYLVIAGYDPVNPGVEGVYVYRFDLVAEEWEMTEDFSVIDEDSAFTGGGITYSIDLGSGPVADRIVWTGADPITGATPNDLPVSPGTGVATVKVFADATGAGIDWIEEPLVPPLNPIEADPGTVTSGGVLGRLWNAPTGPMLSIIDAAYDNGNDPTTGNPLPRGRLVFYTQAPGGWERLDQYVIPHEAGAQFAVDSGTGDGMGTAGGKLAVIETVNGPNATRFSQVYLFDTTLQPVDPSVDTPTPPPGTIPPGVIPPGTIPPTLPPPGTIPPGTIPVDNIVVQEIGSFNASLIYQASPQHIAWGDDGELLLHAKPFTQGPFNGTPYHGEDVLRHGSLHYFMFNPTSGTVTNELHMITCTEVDPVRPTGNLFHATRAEVGWVALAMEDVARDNRDPEVTLPYDNDEERLYEFNWIPGSKCEIGDEWEPRPPDPVDPPDNRDVAGKDQEGESGGVDRPNDPDENTTGESHDASKPKPTAKPGDPTWPIDRDGDGVPENEVPGRIVDNCPTVYNPPIDSDRDGTPDDPEKQADSDGDGIGDECDFGASEGAGGNPGTGNTQKKSEGVDLDRYGARLGPEVWMAMVVGVVLILLLWLVARRRQDDD